MKGANWSCGVLWFLWGFRHVIVYPFLICYVMLWYSDKCVTKWFNKIIEKMEWRIKVTCYLTFSDWSCISRSWGHMPWVNSIFLFSIFFVLLLLLLLLFLFCYGSQPRATRHFDILRAPQVAKAWSRPTMHYYLSPIIYISSSLNILMKWNPNANSPQTWS